MCELLVSCSSTCGLIEIIFVSLTYSDVNKFYVKYISSTECLTVGVFIHDKCLSYLRWTWYDPEVGTIMILVLQFSNYMYTTHGFKAVRPYHRGSKRRN